MDKLKYKWIRSVAWFVRLVGFLLLYLALERVDAMFIPGGLKLGFTPHEAGWLSSHFGGLSIILIGISYVFEFIEHWLDPAHEDRR